MFCKIIASLDLIEKWTSAHSDCACCAIKLWNKIPNLKFVTLSRQLINTAHYKFKVRSHQTCMEEQT